MRHLGYMAMLAFTVVGSFWLEIALKVKVLKRIKLALRAIIPGAALFFDKNQVLGIYGPFNIPLEEFLFFLIVPLAAIMTIEAVTTVRKDLNDEL